MTAGAAEGERIAVDLGARSYAIQLVDGPVSNPAAHADFWTVAMAGVHDIALVTNDTLAPLYGHALAAGLGSLGLRVVKIAVADGERYKNADMLAAIHDAMLDAQFDRDVLVVALGGGVVGDVAGFAAATYQRGVRCMQLPTTLLAQVDSSVGGKTAINHRLGKNMIGAFHQPVAVVVDLSTLDTLPAREYAAGLAEIVKVGIGLDAGFFAWLEQSMPRLLEHDTTALMHAIRRSCELKAAIVGDDEREAGRRALLNLGHTFGHAIEAATGYGTWLHGEAVAAGLVLAARLSQQLGLIGRDVVDRLRQLLSSAGLPLEAPRLTVAEWRRWMSHDKKTERGQLRFVLLDAIGRSHVASVDDRVLDAMLAADSGIRADAVAPATTH